MPESMTLLQEFFRVRNVMNQVLWDLQIGDYLLIGIDRDRCFQESFSGFTGSQGIVMTGVLTGEPGRVYGGIIDPLAPVIEQFHKPVE